MSRFRLLFIALLIVTACRILIGSQQELSPDEAYYYQWAQRLDWAYYSKGPAVATAIWLGTSLLGATEVGVRFLSPLLGLGTSLVLFFMARRLYGEAVAFWAVILTNVTPIFQAGGMVMTIDALSIFFWAAALFTFWRALERSDTEGNGFSWFWPATGALMGLGFLAKYTNAMQLLSVVLVLLLSSKLRREFKRPGFWSMLAVFSLAILPPVIWNAQHDWITIQHLTARGGLDTGFKFRPGEFLDYIVLHLGVYSPLIFLGMMAVLFLSLPKVRADFKTRFLVIFAAPLIILYFTLSLKQVGEPNWTAPGFVSLGILATHFWVQLAEKHRWARFYAVVALGLGLILSVALVNTDGVRRLGWNFTYKRDPSGRLRGWKTVATSVHELRQRLEKETGTPFFLIGNKYQTVSSLAFYLPEKRVEGKGHPPAYIVESQAIENQYSFWPRYDEMTDVTEIARTLLPKVADLTKREALQTALRNVEASSAQNNEQNAQENRRILIRALLAVDPKLPLDEYASEEMGVSLFFGRNALYVTDREERWVPNALSKSFEKVEMIELWQETRRGLPLRSIRVFACYNYRSLPL